MSIRFLTAFKALSSHILVVETSPDAGQAPATSTQNIHATFAQKRVP
jgi:hypothetical protein